MNSTYNFTYKIAPNRKKFITYYTEQSVTLIPDLKIDNTIRGYVLTESNQHMLLYVTMWERSGRIVPFSIFLTQNGVRELFDKYYHTFHCNNMSNESGYMWTMAPIISVQSAPIYRPSITMKNLFVNGKRI